MPDILRMLTSVLCGVAGFLWGRLDGLLLALIAFVTVDYITGVVAAIATRNLSSSTGFVGLARKGLIFAVVAVAHVVDSQVMGGGSSVCRSAVIGFYLANEGLSILENAGRLGVPFPAKLRQVLSQLKEDSEEEKE